MATTPYVSVVDADIYFGERPGSAVWAAATSTEKLKALQTATKAINRQFYKGQKADSTSDNAFPRVLPRFTQSEVPQEVLDACCEEAIAVLAQYGTPRLAQQQQGVASASFSGSSVSFRPGSGKGLLSQIAKECLMPYLLGAV